MKKRSETAVPDVAEQVRESEASAEQKGEDGDCCRSAASGKAVGRKVAITLAAKAKDFSAKFPSIKISKDT